MAGLAGRVSFGLSLPLVLLIAVLTAAAPVFGAPGRSPSRTLDNTNSGRPTVEVSGPESGYVKAQGSFEVSIEFSEAVTGFNLTDSPSDIMVGNGEVVADSLASDDSISWTASIDPDGTGEVTVQVRANAALGTGGGRNRASNRLTVGAVNPPGRVRDLRLDDESDRTLKFSWLGPVSNGGAPIVEYQYRYAAGQHGTNFTEWEGTDSAAVTEATVTGLTNGTTYNVQVRARNAASAGNHTTLRNGGKPNPQVSIEPVDPSVQEGRPAVFTLTREGATTDALDVKVQIRRVRNGVSSFDSTKDVRFGTGSDTATLSVPNADNSRDERNTQVVAYVRIGFNVNTYTVGTPSRATVTVVDNDGPVVTVAASADSAVTEGNPATFTVTRAGVLSDSFTVDVTVTQEGEYLTDAPPTQVVFPPGQANATLSVPTHDDDLWEQNGSVTATIPSGGDVWTVGESASASRTVENNDLEQYLTVAARAAKVSEGRDAVFVLTRKQISVTGEEETLLTDASGRGELTVTVAIDEEPPDAHTPRFTTGDSRMVTFAAGAATATVSLATAENHYHQPDGTVTATVQAQDGVRVPAEDEEGYSADVIIDDDDILPLVSVSAAESEVDEGDDVIFTLTRTGDTTRGLRVYLDLEGLMKIATPATKSLMPIDTSPIRFDDLFGEIPSKIRYQTRHRGDRALDFAPGNATATLTMTTVADEDPEGDGYLEVAIQPKKTAITYRVSSQRRARVLVRDDDLATLTFEVLDPPEELMGRPYTYAMVEGTVYEHRVTRTGDASTILGYEYELYRSGPLLSGDGVRFSVGAPTRDYAGQLGPISLYGLASGKSSITTNERAIYVKPVGGEMSIGLRPMPTCDYCPRYRLGTPASYLIEVINRAAGVSIEADSERVEEGGAITYTLTRVWHPTHLAYYDTNVDLTVDDPSGVLADPPPGIVTIPKGHTTASFTLQTLDDSRETEDRQVTVSVAAPENPQETSFEGEVEAVPPFSATVTVADNDQPGLPVVTITPIHPRANWEGTAFNFWVERNGDLDSALTVYLTATEEGEFFSRTPDSSITIPRNRARIQYVARTVDDQVDEPNGSITVTLDEHPNYILGDPSTATLRVDDNEGPTIIIKGPASPVREGSNVVIFRVLLNQVPQGSPPKVDWTTEDGTAEAPSDYTRGGGTLTLTGNEATIQVFINEDQEDEDDETFRVVLSKPQNASLGKSSAEATITDDDDPTATVSIESVPESDVAESAGHAEFLVTLSAASQREVEVDWRTKDFYTTAFSNAATAGLDYTPTTGTVTFPRETTEQRIRVAVRDDLVDEEYPDAARRHSEAFQVLLTAARHASIDTGMGRAATEGWIRDDDQRGVKATPAALSIAENDAGAYDVVLTSRPTAAVTVAVDIPDGSDLSVDDPTLTFTRLNWDQPQTVTITAEADTDNVADPPVTISHSPTGGDYLTAPADQVRVTITGDGSPALGVEDARASEGDDAVVFRVSLSKAATSQVTVSYETSDETATAGSDYTAASGTLIFAPGASGHRTVRVNLTDDSTEEETETFTLTLTRSVNAILEDASATGTITDNDQGFTVTGGRVDETAGEIVFTVNRRGDTSAPASVRYATQEDTAAQDLDYAARRGTLTFASGESKKIVSVPVLDDEIDEDDESFNLLLSHPEGTVIATGEGWARGVIADDDPPPAIMAPFGVWVHEEDGRVRFRLTLSAPSARPVSVNYATTTGGTVEAEPALDYVSVSGTVVFKPGQTEKTFSVELVDDSLRERWESFLVEYRDPVNATLRREGSWVVIQDNDPYEVTIKCKRPVEEVEPDDDTVVEVITFVEVKCKDATVVEGSALFFDLERDGDPYYGLTVTLGRTIDGVDAGDVTVDFDRTNPWAGTEGSSTAEYRWQSTLDSVVDDDKTYAVTIKDDTTDPPDYLKGSPNSASVTVTESNFEDDLLLTYEEVDTDWTFGEETISIRWTVRNVTNESVAAPISLVHDTDHHGLDEPDKACSDTALAATGNDGDSCSVTYEYTVNQLGEITRAVTVQAFAYSDYLDVSNTVTLYYPGGDYPTFTVSDAEAAEDDRHLEFTISLSESIPVWSRVKYSTADGTATKGEDYVETKSRGPGVEFNAGETSKTVQVPLIDDNVFEGDETLTLYLTEPWRARLSSDSESGVGTITDDNDLPGLSIADKEVAETAGQVEMVVRLSEASTAQVTVEWSTVETSGAGSATPGADYTAAGGTLTFPAGSLEQRLTVPVLDDQVDEADRESLEVVLSNPVGASPMQPPNDRSMLTILDNDQRGVAVTPTSLDLLEGATGRYTVALTSQPSNPEGVTVEVNVPAGAGLSVNPPRLTFTPQAWHNPRTVTVYAQPDANSTDPSPVTLTHTVSGSDYGAVTADNVTVRVTDRPVLSVTDRTVAEDAGQITIQVRLNRAGTETVTVNWAAVDGTATAGSDFTGQLSGALSFAPNVTSQTITLMVTDDTVDEEDQETFTIVLTDPANAGVAGPGTIKITDNEDPPVLSITETEVGSEETGFAKFTVALAASPSTQRVVTVDWKTVRFVGDRAGIPGVDYISANGSLTFQPGILERHFYVTISDDDTVESTERYRVGLSNPHGAQLPDPALITASILDDDGPGIEITPTELAVPEGAEGDYTVRLTGPPNQNATVTVTVPTGTDLTVQPLSLTFTRANWRQPQTVTVTAAEDDDILDDSQVTITHRAAGGWYDDVVGDDVTVTIQENDFPTLSIADNNAGEDDGAIEFTLTLSQASDKDVSASWSTANGTATAGEDYQAVADRRVTIGAGTTRQTVSVTVLDDGAVDPNETFTVTLTDPVNTTLDDGTATGTIVDDDQIKITVKPTALEIGEGGTESYQVLLGAQPTGDVTVTVAVPADTDVTANPTTLTFNATTWATPQFVDVNAASDDDAIADSPVTLTHAVSGGGYDSVTADPVTVTITEETQRGVTVAPAALTIDEGDTGTYRMVLQSEPSADVTVRVTVPNGAEAKVDKTTLTFTTDNWDQPQAVTVNATDDDDAIADSPFTLTHTAVGGDYAAETVDGVTITINDTTVPVLATEGVTAGEGDGNLEFTVTLLAETADTVTVQYATADNTATAGSDYTETSGTLTFSAGEDTQTVSVPILDDSIDEQDERFTLTLTNAANAELGDNGETSLTVTGTITDDDQRGLRLSAENLTVTEGDTNTYTVALASKPTSDVEVTITVPPGTDISVDKRTLTFTTSNWNDAQTVTVNAYQDRDAQPDPQVAITHTTRGADYGSPLSRNPGDNRVTASLNVRIAEDDKPKVTLSLDSDTISENGGVATVTAALSEQSSSATTVMVSIDPTTTSSLSANKTLTIAAGQTVSRGVVTITATNGDSVYTGNREVTVQGTASNTVGVDGPEDVTLTITDDDAKPQVTLSLNNTTISEDGGVATVTASLSASSTAATTVTVSIDPTTTSSLSANKTLTIAAGNTASTGVVTITATNGDSVYTGNRQVTVKGTAVNTVGVDGPEDVTLTITDDDTKPEVTLSLNNTTISEDEGVATVTASLNTTSTAETTVTVSIDPTTTSTLSANTTLTIAAGNTTSTGVVTITATNGDSVYTGNRQVTVKGAAVNTVGVDGPEDVMLTITDDDAKPQVTLSLDSDTISENGGVATVTASLSASSTAATTVTVSIDPTNTSTLSANTTLTIAAGNTTSTGVVTVTAVNGDSVYTGNREVTVQGTASNSVGVDGPDDVTLTITDDDAKPQVTLSLNNTTISEDEGVATVTASLSASSTAATTVTVSIDPTNTSTLSANTTLTIAAGNTTSTGVVTITATNSDSVYTGNREVTVQGTASNTVGVDGPDDVTLTITDDDTKPQVTLSLNNTTISEDEGVATVTASLNTTSTAETTVTVSIDPTNTSTLSANKTLTIAAGNTESTGEVTITATNSDSVYTGNREVTVQGTASNTVGVDGPEDVMLTITDDDAKPQVTLSLNNTTIREDEGVATVTATLSATSTAETTVTISIDPTNTSTLSTNTTLTIAAGNTTSTGVVTVTAVNGDSVYTGNREVTVQGTASNTVGVDGPEDVMLTITDDDTKPEVTLSLNNTTISEDEGVATVTATLSATSTAETTVTISIDPTNTSTLSANTTLTIAAGNTASTGTVTITATNADSVYTGNREVTVQGTASNSVGVDGPEDVMLTITDDDAKPEVTLSLDSDTISENGGVATVTASLSASSTAATTVTVSIDPTNTSTLSANTTLTIAAGNTTSTGTVTITATNGDSVYTGNREVTVQGTASNTVGVDGPDDVTLTITDDDTKPQVTLSLNSDTISENGGVATVTASLSASSTAATTVTVSIDPTNTSTLSANTTLTIAAGNTASTGTVTITATNGDSVYTGNREVTVKGAAVNSVGVDGPDDVTLTITDDDTKPQVTLSLNNTTISEDEGVATVTASLSATSTAETTVTVSIDPTNTSSLSANTTLTIAAGNTESTGVVTVTAVNGDSVYTGNREVTVQGTASNSVGVDGPDDVMLTITDDDTKPQVTLSLNNTTISEDGGVATVTATLSATSTAETTVTVSIDPTTTSTLSANTTLTIAAGNTASTGVVTITATNSDSVYTGNRQVTVSGSAVNTVGVDGPDDVTLTITDDDTKPQVTLSLNNTTISEDEGVATVTATLSATSTAETTVTVSIDPTNTSTLSANTTLTIAAGNTESTGEVTITATNGDSVYTGNRQVTVSGSAVNSVGVDGPDDVTLTITDDDTKPQVTLSLNNTTISEDEGVATVTASLSASSTAATTVTVSIDPTNTSTLSANTTLTIAAGNTESTGEVTITATNGDSVYTGNRQVTVSGSAVNSVGVDGPDDVTLTITDDDTKPQVTLSLNNTTISEDEGVATVTASLSASSTAATTVTVSIDPTNTSSLSANTTLTIAAGNTESTGEVTITATNGDSVYTGNREVTVQGTASNTVGVDGPDDVTLTITDDDTKPQVTLSLNNTTISEDGGVATVTATLSATSTAETTVTVSIDPTTTSTLSANTTLTIAAGNTASTGVVTITATNGDSVYTGNRQVTVSGSAVNTVGVDGPDDVTLTITDDDTKPQVTLSLNNTTISEDEGVATVTASLSASSTAATTVTVSIDPTTTSTLSANTTLTIAAGNTESTGEVTVTAVNGDSVYTGNRQVTVKGTASNTVGVDGPDDVTLTITDDDTKPQVTLSLNNTTISEDEGVATVTASLSASSTAATTVTVSIDPTTTSTLSANTTLTIAAGNTESTGEVTVTAVNGDSVYTGNRQVTVSGSAVNTVGVDGPDDVMLTITDDDTKPQVTLSLDSDTISENGGVATVTASLSASSTAATTVTVSIDPTTTSTLSANTTLTIAAGNTESTGVVTITATNGDSVYTGNRQVTVSGSAVNTVGVDGPDDVMLTITDDDTKPQVTLSLNSDTISENEGVATVTATLSATSTAETTVTVSIDPTTTSTLSANTTLTIAAGNTTSTGTVTITATNGDSVYTGNRQVTVKGTAVNTVGVDGPDDVTLTITDDDTKPQVILSLNNTTISEDEGVATVTATLSATSTAETTVTVSIDPTTTSTLSANTTLTIAAGNTESTGVVTVTAVNDSVYTGNRQVTVSGSAVNSVGVDGPDDVTLTITDDDTKPQVTLSLDSDTISENGGVATVTASLSATSTAETTVTVSIDPTTTSTLSANTTLTIAAGNTESTGVVTVTAVNDSVYTGDREVAVKGAAVNSVGVDGPDDVMLTIIDDDAKPEVTLRLARFGGHCEIWDSYPRRSVSCRKRENRIRLSTGRR